MPYHVENDNPNCSGYAVVKDSDGEVMGCHSTRRDANGQVRALYANEEESALAALPWEGILCLEGVAAEDSTEAPRFMLADSLSWRDLPIPLMAMLETGPGGHEGAKLAGRIDRIWRGETVDGVTPIWGAGELTTAFGVTEVAQAMDDRSLRGVSVDLTAAEWVPVLRDTLEERPDAMLEDIFSGQYYFGLKSGVIGAATVCPVQAMADATLALVASAEGNATLVFAGELSLVPDMTEALTASAVGIAPLAPPAEWFRDPELRELTPLTVTDDGQVYGHLAPWGVCHRGVLNQCILAPRSRTGYAEFELGGLRTAEGEVIRVGKITVGAPHAPYRRGEWTMESVRRHYDETGTVGAFVCAGEDRYGVWVAGAVRSDASPEVVRDMLANPLSGDWRRGELQAALCVPVPGYAVPRALAAIVASGDGYETEVLIASVYGSDSVDLEVTEEEPDCGCDESLRQAQFRALAIMADDGIGGLIDVGFVVEPRV